MVKQVLSFELKAGLQLKTQNLKLIIILMYVLLVYDVEVRRVVKVHKFLKRHLHWVQNSVFEGELTDSQIETVRAGLRRLIDAEADSVLLYTARDQRCSGLRSPCCRPGSNLGPS